MCNEKGVARECSYEYKLASTEEWVPRYEQVRQLPVPLHPLDRAKSSAIILFSPAYATHAHTHVVIRLRLCPRFETNRSIRIDYICNRYAGASETPGIPKQSRPAGISAACPEIVFLHGGSFGCDIVTDGKNAGCTAYTRLEIECRQTKPVENKVVYL